MRILRLSLYYIIGLMLGGWVSLSYAETIPSTPTATPAYTVRCSKLGGGYGAYISAASMSAAQVGACQSAAGRWEYIGSLGWETCNLGASSQQYSASVCTGGQGGFLQSCPSGQNWTLSGSTCTRPDCVSPQVRDSATGTCTAPPCPSAGSSVSGISGGGYSGTGSLPDDLCISGCGYSRTSVSVQIGVKSWASYAGRSTGAACAGSSTPANSNTNTCLAKGQCGGVLNGVEVCTSCTKTENKNESTVIKTPAAGGASTEFTDSKTVCADGVCVTTKTTSTTSGGAGAGGAGVGSTTATDSEVSKAPQSSFCADNPNDLQCKKPSVCDEYPDRIECKDLGAPSDGEGLVTKASGLSALAPVSLATNMSCPSPLVLPKNYGTFNWQPACELAGYIRPIALLFAWLGAGMLLAGALRIG